MFVPQAKYVYTPDQAGIAYDDVYVPTSFNTTLHGWLLKSKGESKGNILFVHGNGENISTHFLSVAWLTERGFNVLIYDYQGYGKSTGSPSVAEEIENVTTMANYLVNSSGGPIILYGQSLGGAIATSAVHSETLRTQLSLLIVESSFPNFRRIVQEKLGSFWLSWPLQWPLSLGFTSPYNPEDVIGSLSPIPVLLVHGKRDQIVTYQNSIELMQRVSQPAALWTIEDGGHIMAYVIPEFRDALTLFLNQISEKQPSVVTPQSFQLPAAVVEYLRNRNSY